MTTRKRSRAKEPAATREQLEKLLDEFPAGFLEELLAIGLRLELGEPVEIMLKSVPTFKLTGAWKKKARNWARVLTKCYWLLQRLDAAQN